MCFAFLLFVTCFFSLLLVYVLSLDLIFKFFNGHVQIKNRESFWIQVVNNIALIIDFFFFFSSGQFKLSLWFNCGCTNNLFHELFLHNPFLPRM